LGGWCCFLSSRLLLFIHMSMCMHSAADCLIVRIASMKHWKWAVPSSCTAMYPCFGLINYLSSFDR
jgi:hypothetical protein